MIYTLTLNPSIDYVVHLDRFVSGITNRTTQEEYEIGGKGINVSCILAQLGISSTALGFTAGFTGEAIEKGLIEKGIRGDFIRLKEGISRINIKVRTDVESEINGQGPYIADEDLERLYGKIRKINAGDTLVLAGSVPASMPEDTYERILALLGSKQVRVVVDAADKLLLRCLVHQPFLIKPNRQEISEIFGIDVRTKEQTESCARELMKQGARNVIVSLGDEGAFLFAEDGKTYPSGTLKETVLNTVGSGDSMIAGFLAGYEQTKDFSYALRLGTACGNATAFSPGLADRRKIDEVMAKLSR